MNTKNIKFYFYEYRQKAAWVLLLVFIVLPFVYMDGNPFLKINFFEKEFFIFFKEVYPQDFYLLAFLMVIFFWLLIVITFRFGRVFCGWICPQTVFLEFLFKKMDDFISKYVRAEYYFVIQKVAYVLVSFLVSLVVLSYIIGYPSVVFYLSHFQEVPFKYLVFSGAFSLIFFIVFNIIREKSCTLICPYGRVQGIFLNDNTNTIIYDVDRGEPRGKLTRNNNSNNLGDCIDCKLCVKVCPTHIDIRNGNQLECINCFQCVDACNEVMDKLDRPQNLISYNSNANIKNSNNFHFKSRDYWLAAASIVVLVAFFSFFLTRSPFDVIIKRVPGTTFQVNSEGNFTNLYNVQFINKSKSDFALDIKTNLGEDAKINIVGGGNQILGDSKSEIVMFLEVPKSNLKPGKNKICLSFYRDGEKIKEANTFFISSIN